jgi:hypothetical protein
VKALDAFGRRPVLCRPAKRKNALAELPRGAAYPMKMLATPQQAETVRSKMAACVTKPCPQESQLQRYRTSPSEWRTDASGATINSEHNEHRGMARARGHCAADWISV